MKLLVLGGAGYVGSAFCYHAIDQGHSVVVYDSLERGHDYAVPAKASFVKGDILDVEKLTKAFGDAKPDAVLHFAAYALVAESVANPVMYFKNNVTGVITLFEAMMASGCKVPLVFSSSCAVFGVPPSVPLTEDQRKAPASPYGTSKLLAEYVIADSVAALGINATALRYFNAAGADLAARTGEDHEPETHLIPNILKAGEQAGGKVTIFGRDYPTRDGTCVRDYIHVTDLAEAHLQSIHKMKADKSWGFKAIHLGSGDGYTNLEVVECASKVLKQDIKVEFAGRRDGDPAELYADVSLAKSLLGFAPKHSDLETIIRSAQAWREKSRKKSG